MRSLAALATTLQIPLYNTLGEAIVGLECDAAADLRMPAGQIIGMLKLEVRNLLKEVPFQQTVRFDSVLTSNFCKELWRAKELPPIQLIPNGRILFARP